MRSKELRVQRAKLIADARDLSNSHTYNQVEDEPKFDAMMAEADTLAAQIERIEAAEAAFAATQEDMRSQGRREGISADEAQARRELESSTFLSWVRFGADGLDGEQQKIFQAAYRAGKVDIRAALGTTPDSAGGYTVPQEFMAKLIDAEKAYGGMMDPGVAYIFDTAGGNAMPIPTDNDTTNAGAILGENVQVGTQDVTFGSVTMNAYTYTSKLVLVSNQLLQDSAFDLNSFLSGKLGTRLGRIVNTHTTTGDGASKPTGVITASTLGYTAGGSTTSGETATILSDDLIELEHSVDPAYRRNARFMMSDAALKVIKKLKDGQGRPLWLSGIAIKEPDTINGYPYTINQDMPAPAASAKSMLFGDFSNYFIRRVVGAQLLRLTERYADFNQTGFLAFQRWDGQLIDAGTHPIKYLQNSAS